MKRLVAEMLGDKTAIKKREGDTVTISASSGQEISFNAKTGLIIKFAGYKGKDLGKINDGWGDDREIALMEAGISASDEVKAIVRQRYERNQQALKEAVANAEKFGIQVLDDAGLAALQANKMKTTGAITIYRRPDGNLQVLASDSRVANRLVRRLQAFVEGKEPGKIPDDIQNRGIQGMDWTLEETAAFL